MARHRIRIRRGTAAEWAATNRVLRIGEVAFETDTKAIKAGDGSTAYNDLPYSVLVQADKFSVVEVASGDHTLVASNLGKMIRFLEDAGDQDLNIPLNASLAVAKNTAINVIDSIGTGTKTVVLDATAVINGVTGGSFTINAWGMVTLIKLDNADTWQVIGAHGTVA